jgi:hypothetical protein
MCRRSVLKSSARMELSLWQQELIVARVQRLQHGFLDRDGDGRVIEPVRKRRLIALRRSATCLPLEFPFSAPVQPHRLAIWQASETTRDH